MAIQGIHPIPIIANSLSNATISIKKYRTEQKISSVCITITIGKNPALPSCLPAHHMHVQLLIGDCDSIFIEFELHRLLQFIKQRPVIVRPAPNQAGNLNRMRIVRLHADHGRDRLKPWHDPRRFREAPVLPGQYRRHSRCCRSNPAFVYSPPCS